MVAYQIRQLCAQESVRQSTLALTLRSEFARRGRRADVTADINEVAAYDASHQVPHPGCDERSQGEYEQPDGKQAAVDEVIV